MAKARKKIRKPKKKGEERPEFPSKQTPTANLEKYLALVRKNEMAALGAFFLLILLAVLAFAAPDFLNDKKSPKALEDKISSMEGASRVKYLERKQKSNLPEPKHTIVNFELGRSYYIMSEYDKALEVFQELETHYQTYTPPEKYRNIYAFLAKIYIKREGYSKSDLYLTRAITLGGHDDEFKYMLGETLIKAERPIEAARWLELVVNHDTYGEKAQEYLEQIEQGLVALSDR